MLRPFADLQYADAVLAHIHFAQIGLLISQPQEPLMLIHAIKSLQYPERSQNKIYRTLMMPNQLLLGNIIAKDWDKSTKYAELSIDGLCNLDYARWPDFATVNKACALMSKG